MNHIWWECQLLWGYFLKMLKIFRLCIQRAYIKWQKQDLINLFLVCVSLMVWIKEYKSTSSQNEFCTPIIYSRLPSNTLCNLVHTNTLRWSNTWDTWGKRTSGMLSCITPTSVAGEKQQWKAEEWSDIKKKKKPKEKNSQKHENRLRWRAARQWKNSCGISQSKGTPLSISWVAACLFIYLGADRFLHRKIMRRESWLELSARQ